MSFSLYVIRSVQCYRFFYFFTFQFSFSSSMCFIILVPSFFLVLLFFFYKSFLENLFNLLLFYFLSLSKKHTYFFPSFSFNHTFQLNFHFVGQPLFIIFILDYSLLFFASYSDYIFSAKQTSWIPLLTFFVVLNSLAYCHDISLRKEQLS